MITFKLDSWTFTLNITTEHNETDPKKPSISKFRGGRDAFCCYDICEKETTDFGDETSAANVNSVVNKADYGKVVETKVFHENDSKSYIA